MSHSRDIGKTEVGQRDKVRDKRSHGKSEFRGSIEILTDAACDNQAPLEHPRLGDIGKGSTLVTYHGAHSQKCGRTTEGVMGSAKMVWASPRWRMTMAPVGVCPAKEAAPFLIFMTMLSATESGKAAPT